MPSKASPRSAATPRVPPAPPAPGPVAPTRREPGDSYVQSFARGLEVLRSFSAQAPAQTISEVSERSGLTRAGDWDAACNATNRARFIANLVAVMRQYGYDGIDLDIEQDWQSPTHTDYIACIAGLRAALDAITPRRLLTAPGDPESPFAPRAPMWIWPAVTFAMFDPITE